MACEDESLNVGRAVTGGVIEFIGFLGPIDYSLPMSCVLFTCFYCTSK